MAAKPVLAAVPRPIAVATPRMINHSGLVCLLAATNAWDGRRIASMNANASTTNAAMASTSKSQVSAEYAPGLLKITMPGYRLAAGLGTMCPGSASVAASASPACCGTSQGFAGSAAPAA